MLYILYNELLYNKENIFKDKIIYNYIMSEEYIDIKGYEGLYKINKNGDVLNVKRNKILKPQLHIGYYYVKLHKEGKLKAYTLHRLLGIHFIPNPDNHPVIDHIDRNRTNNNIENLRWCTRSDNSKNKEIKGCIYKFIKKYKEKKYISYRVTVRNNYLKQFKTYDEASEFLKIYLEENE